MYLVSPQSYSMHRLFPGKLTMLAIELREQAASYIASLLHSLLSNCLASVLECLPLRPLGGEEKRDEWVLRFSTV